MWSGPERLQLCAESTPKTTHDVQKAQDTQHQLGVANLSPSVYCLFYIVVALALAQSGVSSIDSHNFKLQLYLSLGLIFAVLDITSMSCGNFILFA